MPGGRIEWDDDDAEAAARREVFESANIALGIVMPVTVVKAKDRQNQISQTMVFVGRTYSVERTVSNDYRFMSKETFFRTSSGQSALVRSLFKKAYRALISGEIRGEHAESPQSGREKYNPRSLL